MLYIFIKIFICIYLSIKIIPFYYLKTKEKPILANPIIEKDYNEEFNIIQEFTSMTLQGTLINKNKTFSKSSDPKISIVIGTFNAEVFLKNALLSIQNQDFDDIEIVIVDDYSKDDTVNLIKEYMKIDKRIKFYQNRENKGTLYTKAKGVMHSKGKYVMIIDQDDIYTQKDVFSTLYSYCEKKKLDVLGFASIFREGSDKIDMNKEILPIHYFESNILYQPDISRRMFDFDSNGEPTRVNYVIWDYMFKTKLFINAIKKIDKKYLNTKMKCHEDFLLFFLLSRKAKSLKYIKRIFYVNLQWRNETNSKIKFTREQRYLNRTNADCLSYINYIEFLLKYTDNNIRDKRIATLEFNNWFLNNGCISNEFVKERGIYVCKLFLKNKYIEKAQKVIIKKYLDLVT